ncbi:hypothetical protein RDWZM_003656 [Blomia tropicalis]|uniref:Uncharacterized protein n=1 Tax=Blomia tropicalis TaxID=40697 RepID=A0A9Q0RSS7_BLOTA|nr:hypothetical protein RDWZM_003656 [Blomia tropicalis]
MIDKQSGFFPNSHVNPIGGKVRSIASTYDETVKVTPQNFNNPNNFMSEVTKTYDSVIDTDTDTDTDTDIEIDIDTDHDTDVSETISNDDPNITLRKCSVDNNFVVAIKSFEAENDEQLSLKICDIVQVHERKDDWFRGNILSTSNSGWFPSSNVRTLSKEYTDHIPQLVNIQNNQSRTLKTATVFKKILSKVRSAKNGTEYDSNIFMNDSAINNDDQEETSDQSVPLVTPTDSTPISPTQKRKNIIREMMDKETAYTDQLNFILTNFPEAIKEESSFSSKEVDLFFEHLQFLLSIHTKFKDPDKSLEEIPTLTHSSILDFPIIKEQTYTIYEKPLLLNEFKITMIQKELEVSNGRHVLRIESTNSNKCRLSFRAKSSDDIEQWFNMITNAQQCFNEEQKEHNGIDNQLMDSSELPLLSIMSLDQIEAFQLCTQNYALNAYCKIAVGKKLSEAHTLLVSKIIRTTKPCETLPHNWKIFNITWELSRNVCIYDMEDIIFIRCYESNLYSPHQSLGEASLPIGDIIKQSKKLKKFTKGVSLTLDDEHLQKGLSVFYKITPCLFLKFDFM